jgi:lysophospholipase L1-like esterase
MRRIIIALVVLTTSFVFALGLGEGVVRLYSRMDKTTGDALRSIDPYAVQVEPHGRMGYRQKPHAALHYTNGTIATANAMRFRGPEVPIHAVPGTTRIILLGGSTTHGWFIPDGRTIDVYMRRLLSERYPGRNFEVVNLALDGYDNLQNLERLRSDGLPLKPDIVVLNDGINDVRNAWLPNLKENDPRTLIWEPVLARMRREQAQGGPSLWTRTKHYSVLARVPGFIRDRQRLADELATKGEQNRKASTTDAMKATTPATARVGGPPYPEAADFFEKYGRVIVQESLESGAAVLLSTPASSLPLMPDTTTSTQSYWVHNAKTTQQLRDELARRLQRITADEQELGHRVRYVAPKLTDMKLFLDDCHLTPDGFAAEAAILVDALAPFIDSTAAAK